MSHHHLHSDLRGRRKRSGERRWSEHNSARQDRILRAAVELLEENEPGADISIQQIAERAGLARSVVYRQFDNREDLDARIRAYIMDTSFERFESVMVLEPGKTAEETLLGIMRTVVDWAAEHPNLYRFEQGGRLHGYSAPDSGLTVGRRRLADALWERFTAVSAILGIDTEPFRPLSHGIIGLVEGVINEYVIAPRDSGSRSTEEIARLLATSVWHLFDGFTTDLGYRFDRTATTATMMSELLSAAADQLDRAGKRTTWPA
ncbi:TetR/AcrR family transcriptional regulator [Nocardia huaxiensis]|uniref:TetR/AcrR family transcriptional regulator n=1 Tax=Nocardia huaxiensis TaxID=2755382 RepID=A0A7D7A009_9NOCA|nr:TetR/AcrR family transcriptional regulator [Nocardia huaxiensis]QLY32629.1 TetR/AcrR family transcriptional regulator [Nocardia huaxiensis]